MCFCYYDEHLQIVADVIVHYHGYIYSHLFTRFLSIALNFFNVNRHSLVNKSCLDYDNLAAYVNGIFCLTTTHHYLAYNNCI